MSKIGGIYMKKITKIILTVFILNFTILYFLKSTSHEVPDIPVISKENQITTFNTKANKTGLQKEQSIAEDIGKVFSDSGSPLPLLELSQIKTVLSETTGPNELNLLSQSNQNNEIVLSQSNLLSLCIFILISLCITYFYLQHIHNKANTHTLMTTNELNSNNINNYYILHND